VLLNSIIDRVGRLGLISSEMDDIIMPNDIISICCI
jgi:hypothetical protein